jgi:flagellar hook-associated protein 1
MPDLLSTAVSGLRAFQRALDVTGHNISNATTPGYSRQRVDLAAREGEPMGNGFIGKGVDIVSISRYYDEVKTSQLRTAASEDERLSTYAANANVLSNLFANATTGLSASIQGFTDAVQGVANLPSSTASRQVLLSEAESLRQRLQTYDLRLGTLDAEINSRVRAETEAVTSAARSIANLNQQIVAAQSATGQPPNDLLDQRDRLINDLSGRVAVDVVKQDDGAWNVFIGNGQPLVIGSRAGSLLAIGDPYEPTRLNVAYSSEASSPSTDMSNAISGGTLGGLLDFRRELLDPARNQLGQIALGITAAVNAQHREGMDLYGNLGGDLFAVGAVEAQPASSNASSATLAATRGAIGDQTAHDYIVEYSGTAWSMRRADTGEPVALTGTGTVANPLVGAGLSIVASGTPAANDSFRLRPTANVIGGLRVQVTDPAAVAAAAPIRTAAATTNTGTGVVSAGEVLDPSNAALRTTTTIQFTSASTYSVNGAGSFTWAAGSDIDLNGWRVQITGAPAVGDRFTVQNNVGGSGDNRNALALAGVIDRGVLSGGTESINGAISRFVGNIGTVTNRVQTASDAQRVIRDEAVAAVDSVSGVNLDEEAANMLRFQQAYQAVAQVIAISQKMFDTLLNATGR